MKSAAAQVGFGLLIGGVFLFVQERFGWASHWTLWAAIGILCVTNGVLHSEVRARVARLEKLVAQQK